MLKCINQVHQPEATLVGGHPSQNVLLSNNQVHPQSPTGFLNCFVLAVLSEYATYVLKNPLDKIGLLTQNAFVD